ncbi:ecdysone oxidase [Amyelois transitella]|uniref:ecdysone oxidase n=1 Tax=Amyelois transitella TaxID=680683 RepID=UPI00298FE109|nr:ecdysone oxidase [Amyelois transitella]
MLPKNMLSRVSSPLLLFLTLTGGVPVDAIFQKSSQHDLPKGVTLKDGQEFEYIVVGAGAGGSAAAARLALAGASVLLVEAGADPDPLSWVPIASVFLQGTPTDWQYETIPNHKSCLSFRGEQCRASRGRCLGGSTSINDMIYTRGSPHDWDSFNISGWAWNDVRPFFLRYEGFKDLDLLPVSSIPYHNTSGTMKVQLLGESGNPWHSRIVEGYLLLNFPYNPDVNAASQIGVTQIVGYMYGGERMSTARGYLSRSDVKKSLKIAKLTRCTGVIIDDNNVAKGITVVTGLFKTKLKLFATREVILSAGAIATPQILMMSGIGHADHLNEMKIPVVKDLSVGDDMTDHMLPLIFVQVDSESGVAATLTNVIDSVDSLIKFVTSRTGPLASMGVLDVSVFANTLCYDYENRQLLHNSSECDLPTMQVIHSFIPKAALTIFTVAQHNLNVNDEVYKQLAEANANHDLLVVSPLVLQPLSAGNVRLASNDPLDTPAIFPNLLSRDEDLEEMIRAIRIVEDLMETRPFKRNNASIVRFRLKGCSDGADYWECYARHMTQLIYHAVGTTAIGRVVDERLRVLGVQRLRVADLGVLPGLVRGNTEASALAVGERVAEFLLEETA